MNNVDKLKQSFVDALSIDINQVNNELTYNSIPEWDSIAHMILITELEKVFDIMLDTDDIIDMSSFAKAKEIIAKKTIHLLFLRVINWSFFC